MSNTKHEARRQQRIIQLELEAKKLEQDNQKQAQYTRRRLREILYEIELEGGFIARGFKSIKDYYESAFPEYCEKYIALENAMKDYELLLGIPIGSYRHSDFVGLKMRKFISKSQAQDLEKAAEIRQTWCEIKAYYGCNPAGAEIRKYMASKLKPKNSDKSVLKIQELEKELEALKAKLQLTETQAVHPITQNYIASLREENEKLRDKLALSERRLNQTEISRQKSA